MEFAELAAQVCTRPSLWVRPATLGSVCAYLSGYDYAKDGGPLAGFREWLVVRFGHGDNFAWQGLILQHYSQGEDVTASVSPERDAELIRELGALIDQFLHDRKAHGPTKIHYDYAQWLLKQSWYAGPLRPKGRGD